MVIVERVELHQSNRGEPVPLETTKHAGAADSERYLLQLLRHTYANIRKYMERTPLQVPR